MKKLLLVISLHILLLLFLRFIAWPENLAWPYLNLSGLAYYRQIFLLYPPLYWLLLSGFYQVFGLSFLSLKVLTYVVVIASDVLLWLATAKKIWPVVIYIPVQIFLEGNGLWPDQLLVPFFLLAYIAWQGKKWFLLGLSLGLAVLTKQTAVYFVVILLGTIVLSSRKTGVLLKTTIGLGLPLLGGLLWLVGTDNLSNFYQETVIYLLTFHVRNPLQVLYPTKEQFLVTLIIFGPAIISGIQARERQLVLLIITAGLGVFSRFGYFHLQPALPFTVLLLSTSWLGFPMFLIYLLLFGHFLYQTYGLPPKFLDREILSNARIINTYVHPGEKTLFINTWDHYYFLTGTLPAGNFYTSSVPNLEYPGMQERVISGLTAEKPKFVFFNPCHYLQGKCYQPEKIARYLGAFYQLVSKLPDGTGIFEYYPVGLRQKL